VNHSRMIVGGITPSVARMPPSAFYGAILCEPRSCGGASPRARGGYGQSGWRTPTATFKHLAFQRDGGDSSAGSSARRPATTASFGRGAPQAVPRVRPFINPVFYRVRSGHCKSPSTRTTVPTGPHSGLHRFPFGELARRSRRGCPATSPSRRPPNCSNSTPSPYKTRPPLLPCSASTYKKDIRRISASFPRPARIAPKLAGAPQLRRGWPTTDPVSPCPGVDGRTFPPAAADHAPQALGWQPSDLGPPCRLQAPPGYRPGIDRRHPRFALLPRQV